MTGELQEETISTERIYSGRIVKLDVDRVRLPAGTESTREVVRHPGASVVLPLLGDGRMVLIKQFRYASGKVLLELPAGTLEEGEDPRACAERELQEETGWRAASMRRVGSIFTTPGFSDELIHCFLATDLKVSSDGTALDEDETIEVVTMGIEKVLESARTGELRDAKTLATIFLARLHGLV